MAAQETPTPGGPEATDDAEGDAAPGEASAAETPADLPEHPPGHLAAAPLIARFGGIRPMAHKLGVPVSTVQGWKQRGSIPLARLDELRAAAQAHDIALDEAELAAAPEAPASAPEPPPRAADTPPPTSSPPAAPAAPPRRGGGGAVVLALLALVVALGAGGLVLYDDWRRCGAGVDIGPDPRIGALEDRVDDLAARPVPPTAPDERIDDALAALSARLEAVEQRPTADTGELGDLGERLTALEGAVWDVERNVEALATALAGLPPPADLAPLGAALDSLAQRGDALDAAMVALNDQVAALVASSQDASAAATQGLAATGAEIAALRAELDAVAATAGRADAGSARAVALSVAARQLAAAVDAGTAFTAERDALSALASDDAAILEPLAELAPAAASGIVPFHMLKARFPAAARAVVQAAREDDDADWLDRAMSRATEVVALRRVDPALEGDFPVAIVARAEGHLDAGDLAAAADEMARLTGPAADAAAGWLADARARLAALQALAAIERRALALLDAAG